MNIFLCLLADENSYLNFRKIINLIFISIIIITIIIIIIEIIIFEYFKYSPTAYFSCVPSFPSPSLFSPSCPFARSPVRSPCGPFRDVPVGAARGNAVPALDDRTDVPRSSAIKRTLTHSLYSNAQNPTGCFSILTIQTVFIILSKFRLIRSILYHFIENFFMIFFLNF